MNRKMRITKVISTICVCVLAIIAFIVFIGQINKQNMWLYICSYWGVLTIKNIADVLTGTRSKNDSIK